MRAPTDLPRRRVRRPRGRLGIAIIIAVVIILLLSLRGIAGFYTDYLWFKELGFTSVWRQVLGAKVVLGAIFTVAFFVILWVNLFIADRIAPTFRPTGPEAELVERYHEVVDPRAGLVRVVIAAVFALIAGPSVSGQWNSWILFRNATSFGLKDAQFHKDISFFAFKLPFYKFVVDWAFASVVIVLIITAVAHYLNGGIRVQTPFERVTPQVKVHLSVLLGVLALLKALGYYLQQFQLDFSTRGVVQGATYTDVKAQLPALKLLIAISIFAFALFIVNIRQRGWVLPVIAVGLWAFVSIVVGGAYPYFIQQYRVHPTESVKERPYIARNIAATRKAMNIDTTTIDDFHYNEQLSAGDLQDNAGTIRNVRLWDPKYLQPTFQKEQELKTFYKINDVDVDRYALDGPNNPVTQTLISARELNADGIPSQSWVNTHLVYTHGYGAVLAPANAVTPDGGPDLLVKDLPPTGSPALQQPAVYFGEGLGGYVLVDTGQQEVDYSDLAGVNHTTTYHGTGGVPVNSWIKRMAFFLRFGDTNVLISGFVNSHSRAIYVRDIGDRVRKAAPFLKYDNDPYPVILDGRIVWIQDAYTTTSRYPYAQKANTDRLPPGSDLRGANFNYIRNSVKVVIDAYNGSMRFFVMDPTDPLVRVYQKAFPRLFTPGSRMDTLYPGLRTHLRYPEDLFRVQTGMFAQYHVTDPATFYSGSDQWDIAQDPGTGRPSELGLTTATTNAQGIVIATREARMDPYYLLMRLPNEQSDSFLILQPFVPFSKDDSRKELTAFMVAKSDPADYGKLKAFVMPRNGQVDGPSLINAKIQQNPDVSKQISLLDQKGSEVQLGSLLLIPIKQSILYIRPLYVQSAGTPLPQFKEAIVVYGDQVVMRETLKDALDQIFGSSPATLEQKPTGGAPTAPTTPSGPSGPGVSPTVKALLDQAVAKFAAAQADLKNGDLAAYQTDHAAGEQLVQQADAALSGQSSTTTTTTTPTSSA